METQGEGREETQHHEMRSTHPYSFLEVYTPKKVIGLRSGSMDIIVHSYIQSSLVEDVEGNNAVRYGFDLAPHAEEGGALSPNIGMLASLQGSPQDLMCGDQGTTHVLHVPLLRRCGTMET